MNRIHEAFKNKDQRAKIIGGSAVTIELLLLFWLFPRLAWLNGNYAACEVSRWSSYTDQYVCEVVGQKSMWDYQPTLLSSDWVLTHLAALGLLIALNIIIVVAYEIYDRFGYKMSHMIDRAIRARRRPGSRRSKLSA